jgi:hypothetical protein
MKAVSRRSSICMIKKNIVLRTELRDPPMNLKHLSLWSNLETTQSKNRKSSSVRSSRKKLRSFKMRLTASDKNGNLTFNNSKRIKTWLRRKLNRL